MLIRVTAVLLMLVALLAIVAGCNTTESDIPWGAPASWEGSPYIPGMSQQ